MQYAHTALDSEVAMWIIHTLTDRLSKQQVCCVQLGAEKTSKTHSAAQGMRL